MQQATVNLFADMGAQPATLQPGLVADQRRRPTPRRRPRRSPRRRRAPTLADGNTVTISGTASDTGGGVVAGVEVSTDGGTTWHPATGTTSWTYTWIVHGSPTRRRIKARAVDDTGNIATPAAGITVTVACPCSICRSGVTPATPDSRRHAARSSSGSSSTVRHRRHGQRDPLLQGGDQHRHARRQPVDRRRHPAGAGDVHRRDGVGLAAGQLLQPGGDPAEHDLRRLLLRAATATTRRPWSFVSTPPPRRRQRPRQPAAARPAANGDDGNGLYQYTGASTFPTSTLPGRELLGRRAVLAPADAARPGDRRQRHGGAELGDRELDGARGRRPGDELQDHAVHRRRRAQTPTTVTGSPPATSATITGLTGGHDLHLHGAGDQRRRAGARVRRRRTRSRPTAAGPPPGARPAVSASAGQRRGEGELDGARRRRRQPDHRLPDHALHRLDARRPRRR